MDASVNLRLDGVALRTNLDVEYLDGIDPYDAQAKMLDLFAEHERFFAMNTEVTGGGKTLSWLTPVCKFGIHTIGLFPRNALIHDQYDEANAFVEEHFPNQNIGVVKITGDELSELVAEQVETNISKGETLERKLQEARREYDTVILLTNPNILVQMANGMYGGTYMRRELNHFECMVVDEFHLATLAGKYTLLTLLDELYLTEDAYSQLSKVVLLSATPDPLVKKILTNHMPVEFHYISSDGGRKPLSQVATETNGAYDLEEGWRAVMPAVDLSLHPAKTFQTHASLLAEETFPDTVSFCMGGQTVVMVDGVKEVGRIHNELSSVLPAKSIQRIDGLTKGDVGWKIENFDALVSNSAVEVGIDFTVDRIIFSAPTADSFIQRLGRLRNRPERLPARAYVPGYVVEKLAAVNPPDEPLNRASLGHLIEDAYHRTRDPTSYAQRYAALELWQHALDMESEMLSEDVRDLDYRKQTFDRIDRFCYAPFGIESDADDFHKLIRNQDSDILESLKSFQASGFSSLVFNVDQNEVQTYDPLALIDIGIVTGVTEAEFYKQLPTEQLRRQAQSSEAFTAGHFIFHGERPNDPDGPSTNAGLVPLDGASRVRRELAKPVEQRQPILTDGFVIETEEHGLVPGLGKVNDEIQDFEVIAFPATGTSYHLRERYSLDAFFRTTNLYAVSNGASVAFGEDALLLHCIMAEAAEQRAEREKQFEDINMDGLLAAGIVDNQTVTELRSKTETTPEPAE
jgi:CRISPR-associated endonuclease/helicase Cas3